MKNKNKSYHIWITTLVSSYESAVVSGLVSKGYSVSAADGNKTSLTSENGPCAVIALAVSKAFGSNDLPEPTIYADVVSVLNNVEAKYYSLIISEFSYDCIWSASNFSINPVEKLSVPSINNKLN